MTTIVHAAGAAELLAAIPVLTGFTPRDSVVLLPFRGSRTAGALRFDLPPGSVSVASAPPDAPPPPSPLRESAAPTAEEFAATAIGLACRVPDTDALAIAVYADGGVSAVTPDAGTARSATPGRPPHAGLPAASLVEALIRRAEACGLHVVEALFVGAGSWADYRDPQAPPRPLEEVPPPPSVPGFAGPAPDQFSGTELPSPGLFAAESVGRALLAVERVLGPASAGRTPPAAEVRTDPRAQETALLLDDLPSFLEEVLDSPEALSPFATAALVWILNRPALRDVALVQWASSIDRGDRALVAQLGHSLSGSAVPPDIGGILIGHGPRPDRDRLGVALTLVRRTITLAPRQARSGPLAAAAWLSWAVGRSTHAARFLDQAQEIDPGLTFVQLLRAVVDAGMLPEWSFRAAAA
ncbi:DUF4192 family protein [Microbacterium sp. Au-Mic1]|uniref:DUF4192 family protein n=1 Tax=Microbacterium sp. Au-Mic1 TaxID=2906457 RepID=UPI001E3780BB|nr:DUF4192 family protein [Microbacterium sp. Au-Mic1]MCE4027235.1 DUF4192 family protein [Microbacterium sp. Au-Mic1]